MIEDPMNASISSVLTIEKVMEAREFRDMISGVLKQTDIVREEILAILKCIKVDKPLRPDQL